MFPLTNSHLSRRTFCSNLLLSGLALIAVDYLHPRYANAETNKNYTEKYHIFVPYNVAKTGGQQILTLRSGKDISVNLPKEAKENQELALKKVGEKNNDIILILHTLYDQFDPENTTLIDKIYDEIEHHTKFIKKESSQLQCKKILGQIKNTESVSDLTTLELLDYIVFSSKLDSSIKQRYEIASNNSRLLEIQQAIDEAFSQSQLSEGQQKKLKATFQYVRSQEIIPNFQDLYDLDAIIGGSSLSTTIKHYYFVASSTSRALTVDAIIVSYLSDNTRLTSSQKEIYLSIYKKIRAGEKISDDDQRDFHSLNFLIKSSNLAENVKFIYESASGTNQQQGLDPNVILDKMLDAKGAGEGLGPAINTTLTVIGTETATGVSFASLAGGAATNSMLAFLGGGSVASGGLGMLGGLAVITGGSALIGAAGLLSIIFISKMDSEDLKNLGIAVGGGTLTGAAGVFAAWTIAGVLGVAETLSGAAAVSTMIATLGGLSVLTGGAAFIASGATFLIWSFLKGNKKRDGNILKELEARSYTLTEIPSSESLARFIAESIPTDTKYGFREAFSAPLIPLDKLSKALSSWISVNSGEKILGLIDTSVWDDAKSGLVFTNQRIIWRKVWSDPNSISYQDLNKIFSLESRFLTKNQIEKLSDLRTILDDSYSDFDNFLVSIAKDYS